MKKILGLGIVAILVMAMVGGGTWAYFSDTETSTGNVLVAGTLDLGLSNTSGGSPTGGTAATWNVTLSNWAPGDNLSGTLWLKNSGTINMSSVNATFSYAWLEGTPLSVDAGPGGSTDNLTQMIIAQDATYDSSNVTALVGQSLETIKGLGTINLGSLAAGAQKAFYINWKFSPTATNGAQGDSATVTVAIAGYQTTAQ